MARDPTNNNSVLNHKTCILAYILKGGNRRKIYRLLLKGQLTIAGISIVTGIYLSNVSRVIKGFEKYGIVKNITPTYLRGCFYQLTPLALEIKSEFEEHTQFRMGDKRQR